MRRKEKNSYPERSEFGRVNKPEEFSSVAIIAPIKAAEKIGAPIAEENAPSATFKGEFCE